MTKTTKNTIKSVIVMMIIAMVAVLALTLADHFIPKYKPTLDVKTSNLLNKICPSGVDDSKAFSDKHFVLKTDEELGFSVAAFNEEFGSSDNMIWAIYQQTKGTNEGKYIIESQAKGRDGLVIMLTAYDETYKIMGVINKSNNESYWNKLEEIPNLFNSLIGKSGTIASGSDIHAQSGATLTLNAVAEAVSLSNQCTTLLSGSSIPKPKPEAVTDLELIANLNKASESTTFTAYPLPNDKKDKLHGIYKGNENNDILIVGKARGWKSMSLLVKVKDNIIEQVVFIEVKEDFEGAGNDEFGKVFSEEWVNNRFVGKSLTEIKAIDNVLNGTSGATLSRTASGLKNCLINALEYIPLASNYINSFTGGNNG